MRIDSNSPAANLLPADRNATQALTDRSDAIESASDDRTTLSPKGTMVQSLTAQAMNLPAVRQDKVNALSQSVSSGDYQLDPAKIANAIIDDGDQ